MQDHKPEDQTAIRTDLGAIFVSLELKSFNLAGHLSLAGWRQVGSVFQAAGIALPSNLHDRATRPSAPRCSANI